MTKKSLKLRIIMPNSKFTNGLWGLNTLKLRQNGCHFCRRNIQLHLKKNMNFDYNFTAVCSNCLINNMPALVQIRAWSAQSHYLDQWWHSLLPHICITVLRGNVSSSIMSKLWTVATCTYVCLIEELEVELELTESLNYTDMIHRMCKRSQKTKLSSSGYWRNSAGKGN